MTHFFLLPGWNDSGPGHWQSLWPTLHPAPGRFTRVDQDDWAWPRRGDWMSNLDEALLAGASLPPGGPPAEPAEPAVLVAHSLGCHLVAAWAAHSQHTGLVKGAWLVAPPDLDGALDPANPATVAPQLHGWRKVVRQALPFPAVVLASSNDPYASLARSRSLAADWGAAFEALGEAGHVNEASGHGAWPQGWARLESAAAGW